MKAQLIELYLSWVNHFITVDKFAAYYRIEIGTALRCIRLGRILHERTVGR